MPLVSFIAPEWLRRELDKKKAKEGKPLSFFCRKAVISLLREEALQQGKPWPPAK